MSSPSLARRNRSSSAGVQNDISGARAALADGGVAASEGFRTTIATAIGFVGGAAWLVGCLFPPAGAVCAATGTALTVVGVVGGAAAAVSYILSLDTARGTVTCTATPQFSGANATQTNGSTRFPINGSGRVQCSAPFRTQDFIDVRLRGDNFVSPRLVANSGTVNCGGKLVCSGSVSTTTSVNGVPGADIECFWTELEWIQPANNTRSKFHSSKYCYRRF